MAKKAAPQSAGKSSPAPAAKAAPQGAPASPRPQAAPQSAPASPRPKAVTQGEIYTAVSEQTGLSRKQVASVFDGLSALIGRELGKQGPGQFVIPGLLKLKVVRKPATKARPGRNPFSGAALTIAARPARNVVRAIPLKALKEMV